ncbi:MAG: hypothetical protein HKN39_05915 [Flavobacteriales bacterium]|nr:hypothetical protein [Flavobacteriales bacterium]
MQNHYSKLAILGIFIFVVTSIDGQYFRRQTYWKQDRAEIFGGIGVSNFLGDLGGRDQIGTDFYWDLELSVTKPAITLGYRYRTSRKTALRTAFSFGVVAGDDKLTKEQFRSTRNLHFRSNIFELSTTFDFEIYEFRPGHRYSLGVKGTGSRYGAVIYGIVGVSGFYFNPQANYQGNWVDLKPLGTEGQNFEDGADSYSNFGIGIPAGIGYRKRVNSVASIGIEFLHRFTFTDYIDDVSTNYYDNTEITLQDGPIAGYLADPSLPVFVTPEGDVLPGIATNPTAQRGDENDKDAFMFITVNYQRRLKKNNFRRSKRVIRRRGKKIVF